MKESHLKGVKKSFLANLEMNGTQNSYTSIQSFGEVKECTRPLSGFVLSKGNEKGEVLVEVPMGLVEVATGLEGGVLGKGTGRKSASDVAGVKMKRKTGMGGKSKRGQKKVEMEEACGQGRSFKSKTVGEMVVEVCEVGKQLGIIGDTMCK
ncbi:hypothetical protein VNO78_32173 [Psophocarpus tetragonolobus]|uniref:Uncharacterized protein n=1 Tax=Psophocarpus tetragonolobus TaxID=3891 RepID=A0AAN9XA94_PSOTE